MSVGCPFCNPSDIVLENERALAVYDRFPVSPGHLLIIPRRHFPDFFQSEPDEIAALIHLLQKGRDLLDSLHHPDGYNVGVNIGRPSGQTIMHVHVHLIPRYAGDMEDPVGGVRGVIPGKQKYPCAC
ncbi:MAG: HIT family protein [Desulfobacteraceae bacterium]|nr:HIT family protein [Desulfobacteraceae bacterium]